MKRIAAFIFLIALVLGCASSQNSGAGRTSDEKYIVHKVQWQGETLGSIAAWYTGSANNWSAIANANQGLNAKKLRLGDTVRIPQNLVKRSEPMPADYLTKKGTLTTQTAAADDGATPPEDTSAAPSQVAVTKEVVKEVSGSAQVASSDLNTQLWNAVAVSDAAQAKSLLESGADANYRQTNRPMLGWAAQNGSVEVIDALIAAKADINAIDGVSHTALMRAVDTNQKGSVEALIKAGADPNIKSSTGETALAIAVKNGYADLVRTLVKGGADLSVTTESGDSLALIAAQNGYPEIITILGEAKAPLDLSNIVYTPLSYAIEQGNKDLVTTLLNAGANPNAKPRTGTAPLILAMDNTEIFDTLLAAKADPNSTNSSGDPALMVAVQNDAVNRIEPLIKAGANVSAKGESGTTALAYAQNMSKTEIAELLKKNGAVE